MRASAASITGLSLRQERQGEIQYRLTEKGRTPNPQFVWSCMTCAAFGSLRVFLSCCKTNQRCPVTASPETTDVAHAFLLFQIVDHAHNYFFPLRFINEVICVVVPKITSLLVSKLWRLPSFSSRVMEPHASVTTTGM